MRGREKEEKEEEEGVVVMGWVVIVRLRLVDREAGEEGVVVVAVAAVDLLAAVCLVEGGQSMVDLVRRDLVEEEALVCRIL